MAGCCVHGSHVGRRNFIKLSALAGAAATTAAIQGDKPAYGQAGGMSALKSCAFKASPSGNGRNVLFITSASPQGQGREPAILNKIREMTDYRVTVTTIQADLLKEAGKINAAQVGDADAIVMMVPGNSSGRIAAEMPGVSCPVIIYPVNFDFIMLEADVAAQFRAVGVNALLANSDNHLIELLKIALAPRILEGKKALIFGRRMDSTSVPYMAVNEDDIYRHTGVSLQFRPIQELVDRLPSVSESDARGEMERWRKEATEVVETNDAAILYSSRLYILMKRIIKEEQLDGASIDCLSFTFGNDVALPHPCLSFTRLRDEGYSVPCEADVAGMLSSMLLETIARRPSYTANVSEVKDEKSTVILRHCVAPLKVMGYNAPAVPYRLRDYHGMGGVTAEVQFPFGIEITFGVFSKNLSEFTLWPARVIERVRDTDAPSFPGGNSPMRKYCTNHLEARIFDKDNFLQNINGLHHFMVTGGGYTKALQDALTRMNVRVVGPSVFSAPA